jgi:hypothetical protein
MMMINAMQKDAKKGGSPLDKLKNEGLIPDVDYDDPKNLDIPGFAHMTKEEKRKAILKKQQLTKMGIDPKTINKIMKKDNIKIGNLPSESD